MMSFAGVLCLAAFLALELAVGPTPHFYSGRDLVLNQHWNPGPVTCLWILGIVFSLLPAMYYLMKVRRGPGAPAGVFRPNAPNVYFAPPGGGLSLPPPRLPRLFPPPVAPRLGHPPPLPA